MQRITRERERERDSRQTDRQTDRQAGMQVSQYWSLNKLRMSEIYETVQEDNLSIKQYSSKAIHIHKTQDFIAVSYEKVNWQILKVLSRFPTSVQAQWCVFWEEIVDMLLFSQGSPSSLGVKGPYLGRDGFHSLH